jgi:hypothetical protein
MVTDKKKIYLHIISKLYTCTNTSVYITYINIDIQYKTYLQKRHALMMSTQYLVLESDHW